MRHIFVRPVRQADTEKFVEWSKNTEGNLFDPDVPKYPSTTVRCAFNSDGPIVYAPIQRPLFIEALAINPEASEIDIAVALKELTQDAVSQAYTVGAGEIYFVCHEETTIKFAKKQLYEEMPYKVFRIKINDLEKSKNVEKPEGSE